MKRIIFITTIVILAIICTNLVKSIYDIYSKKDILLQTQKKLEKTQAENTGLKRQLTLVQSQQFIEEQARDKLFMVKPGESTVLLPQATPAGQSGLKMPSDDIPNWEKWWNLFFH